MLKKSLISFKNFKHFLLFASLYASTSTDCLENSSLISLFFNSSISLKNFENFLSKKSSNILLYFPLSPQYKSINIAKLLSFKPSSDCIVEITSRRFFMSSFFNFAYSASRFSCFLACFSA